MTAFLKLLLLTMCMSAALAQVAYPEDGVSDKKKANLDGRKPLYSPTRCKQHELLYPGDQKDDWICDCAPAAIFHPETEACYPAFRRGPCKEGQMLVLYPEKIIPECRENPCRVDGQFKIQNACYEFGSSDPNPCPMKEYTYVLGVDPKTLLVNCVKLSVQLATRLGAEDDEVTFDPLPEKCARGSRLSVQGRCRT